MSLAFPGKIFLQLAAPAFRTHSPVAWLCTSGMEVAILSVARVLKSVTYKSHPSHRTCRNTEVPVICADYWNFNVSIHVRWLRWLLYTTVELLKSDTQPCWLRSSDKRRGKGFNFRPSTSHIWNFEVSSLPYMERVEIPEKHPNQRACCLGEQISAGTAAPTVGKARQSVEPGTSLRIRRR